MLPATSRYQMCQSEAPDAAPVKPDAAPPASKPKPQAEELAAIRHSPQRKRAIALGRPSDAAGECDVVADPRFDIDKTIFGTLTSPVKRWVQSAKLNHVETWHAEPLAGIESAFAAVSVPRSVSDDAPLFRFMAEECDFSLEHADGSFMDHLHFCADYSALHFSALTRRVGLCLVNGVSSPRSCVNRTTRPACCCCTPSSAWAPTASRWAQRSCRRSAPLLRQGGVVSELQRVRCHSAANRRSAPCSTRRSSRRSPPSRRCCG